MFTSTPKRSLTPYSSVTLQPDRSILQLHKQRHHWCGSSYSECHCQQIRLTVDIPHWHLSAHLYKTLTDLCAEVVQGHQGNRDSRVLWVKDDNLLTTGFNQMRQQEVRLWDSRKLSSSLSSLSLATSNAALAAPVFPLLWTAGRFVLRSGAPLSRRAGLRSLSNKRPPPPPPPPPSRFPNQTQMKRPGLDYRQLYTEYQHSRKRGGCCVYVWRALARPYSSFFFLPRCSFPPSIGFLCVDGARAAVALRSAREGHQKRFKVQVLR
ncbi:hypothetical protein QQF64_025477 [Cirrhinus molitorella]|uniref:Uncharacterized protein n=1 Tax=Cirrhinus molitorella TaxID=172907 RepID=A0ABR3NP65_9TELE